MRRFGEEVTPGGGMMHERDWAVLAAIVERHILTAEPVSSNQLCTHFPMGCSSATVRNSMVRLEEAGFLSHPYSSSGKIPTVKAYRYFVETLLKVPGGASPEVQHLRTELLQNVQEADHLIKLTATVLATVSNLLAVSWVAEGPDERLLRVELARLTPQKFLLMAHTSYQHEIHHVFEVPEPVRAEVLERVIELVNENGRGLGASELGALAQAEWPGLDRRMAELVRQALIVLGSRLSVPKRDEVLVQGAANFIAQPDFEDITVLRRLVGLLDHRRELVQSFEAPGIERNGLHVVIGETPEKGLPPLTFLTVGIQLQGGREARLGVVGPMRMEYRRVIPLLGQTAEALSSVLHLRSGSEPA